MAAADPRTYEVVRMFLYDIAQRVDLDAAARAIRGASEGDKKPSVRIGKRRDTPASLTLPTPLPVELQGCAPDEGTGIRSFGARAKIYDDGAVTVIARYLIDSPFEDLHSLDEARCFCALQGQGKFTMEEFADRRVKEIRDLIAPHTTALVDLDSCERETYGAYCMIQCDEAPAEFLKANRTRIATLLVGEGPDTPLHESQVTAALSSPFAYTNGDLAVFDMDRCLIIDPSRDYEDILLIIEQANYQLLELRALDKLLDVRLDDAENELVRHSKGKRRKSRVSPEMKLARVQKLRFEALFVLENLENSSKIIGDYYLGQIYERLCGIFNTAAWMRSIDRRFDALSSIYEMVKTDTSEQRTMVLEIIFIAVCVIFPVLQILQVILTS